MICPRCQIREKADLAYCKECRRAYRRKWHEDNKEHANKMSKEYFYRNQAKREAQIQVWRDNNRERINAKSAEWARRNKVRKNQISIARNRTLRHRALGYLTQTLDKIVQLRTAGYEVDHIIPVKGKLVSGLHVPWNLQGVSITVNRRKLNKFDDEQYQQWRRADGLGPYIPKS